VTVEKWKILTVFILFDKLPLILPKNSNGFGLPISKLKENTLLHFSNTFLEAFLKFQNKLTVTAAIWKLI